MRISLLKLIHSIDRPDISLHNQYKLWAYEDINTVSKNYFNGTLNPLKFSADFSVYKEVIEVRKNWDIEGIQIKISNDE